MKQKINRKRLITYKGKSQSMKQWSQELNISYSALAYRLCTKHWSIEKAFETPNNADHKLITYRNKTQSLTEWCNELKLPYAIIKSRLNKLHWPIEDAFLIPCDGRAKRLKQKKDSRLNHIYKDIKARCYNPNKKDYKWYGGKGIKVCDEWNNTEKVPPYNATKGWLAFENWALNNGYSADLTIDRIDCSKDYSPDNCRWVTIQDQQNNKSSNHLITYKGKTQTLMQWSRELGLCHGTIRHRLCNLHWSIEKAFETPTHMNKKTEEKKNEKQI